MDSTHYLARLGLGTVQFGMNYGISNKDGQTDRVEITNILSKALELGVDTLDTASGYGRSEQMIGENDANRFKIISKFPANVKSEQDLMESLKCSISDLRITSLYGYLAHDAVGLLRSPQIWQALQECKDSGLVTKVGYSLYNPNQLEDLLAADYIPDLVQLPFNLLDRRFEKYFSSLSDLGCEIHVRSVFLQGLFFVNPTKLPDFFLPVKPILKRIQDFFVSPNEIASFLIKFVLSRPEINKVIFGVNSEAQLVQNVAHIGMDGTFFTYDNWEEIPDRILMPNKWPN
jgi:aryl-alcohol dehydrogenase-like predicted oxidoreductase